MHEREHGWKLAPWLGLALVFGACRGEEVEPALCGDGQLDGDEECDDGNIADGDECTPSCRLPLCGDGYVSLGESCDDGNLIDGDGCSATCQLAGMCGNGVVEPGEECDEEGDGCTPACSLPVCGDGFIAPGEQCDDGNAVETDACTPDCQLPACGDGFVNSPDEDCDDGNTMETDECTTTCTLSPEAPKLELSFSPIKQFEFHWQPTVGAEWYELLERPDTDAEFVQVGESIVGESFSLTVPLHLRANASYKLRACNSLRCSESEVTDVATTLDEAIGYVKASNTDPSDLFGTSVALSADGSILAVGATGEDSSATGVDGLESDGSLDSSGAVYVFARSGASWVQQAYIKASNTDAGDTFGQSLALSVDGSTLAVGAPEEASSATGIDGDEDDNSAPGAGAVYVFTQTGGSWAQQAYIKASNTDADDYFGGSVALSADGSTLVVGAFEEDSGANGVGGDESDNSVAGSGAVYVFTRVGGSWAQQAYVKASNATGFERFGGEVALAGDGNTLAVGASGEQGVYVFERTGASWAQQAYVQASNPDPFDTFGGNVALAADGDTLAVGATGESSGATGVNGDQNDDSTLFAGAVYVFTRAGDSWAQQAYIKASNTGISQLFGSSVALSGDGHTLAVGANFEASDATGINGAENDTTAPAAGAVYVFTWGVEGWEQRAYVKAAYTQSGDLFGDGVSLSADGGILAVAAVQDDNATTGVGNEPGADAAIASGAVYLY